MRNKGKDFLNVNNITPSKDSGSLPLLRAYALRLTAVFLFTLVSGCGNNITGSNTDLSAAHVGGLDCAQSGCHAGFGAAGTVFSNMSSATPVSGVQIEAINTANNSRILIGTSDTLGNFSYSASLSGNFKFIVGSNTGGNVLLHKMPDFKGCNRCHMWPGQEGAPGKLYYQVAFKH